MESLSAILVPVDYLKPSLNALDVAILLSHGQQTHIHLVCVLDPHRLESSQTHRPGLSAEDMCEIETNKIQKLAAQTAQKYRIDCAGICRIGDTVDELIAAANEFSADLVVMNTHTGQDAKAFRLNSDAYNVLKDVACPVLTVPDQQKWTTFKQILFPVRPIAGALDKYEFARMISQKNDAQLTVLALAAPDEVISIHQLQDELITLNTKLAQDGVRSTVLYFQTDLMAETVLEKVSELQSDLLIVTAWLATTSDNFLTGPFTQQIIHNSSIPVLAIRPAASIEATVGY